MDNYFKLNNCNEEELHLLIRCCAIVDRFQGAWQTMHPGVCVPDLEMLRWNAGFNKIGPTDEKPESRDEQIARGALELLHDAQEYINSFSLTNTTVKNYHRRLLQHSPRDAEHRGTFRTNLDMDMQELLEITRDLLQSPNRHSLVIIAFFRAAFIKVMPFMAANAQLANIISYLLLLQNGYVFVSQFPLIAAMDNPPEKYSRHAICLLPETLALLIQSGDMPKGQTRKIASYLNPRRKNVLEYIRNYAPVKISDIMTHFPNESRNTIKKDLLFLRESDLITVNGEGRGMVYS